MQTNEGKLRTMVAITYVEHDGTEHRLEVAAGLTVMAGAIQNGVRGIDAECGGACACATCQVYVQPEWMAKLEPMSELEADTLDLSDQATDQSRLSCQIQVRPELDGLIVRMPASQH